MSININSERIQFVNVLLLNADAQPTNFLPLSVVSWQEAIRYMVLEKVRVVSWYEHWTVRSSNWETNVPAIIMLREYQKPKSSIRCSRRHVYIRDQYKCQYCGTPVTESTATLDHVTPISKGGKSTWTNLSTACKKCNWAKGDNERIKPKILPYKPDYFELANKRKQQGYTISHPSWEDYLSKMNDCG